MTSDSRGEPDAQKEETGCLIMIAVVAGFALLTVPFWANELEESRGQALGYMWQMWLPGALFGGLAFAFERRGSRTNPARKGGSVVGAFGLLGYVVATQAGPAFLGAFLGLMSGLLITFGMLSGFSAGKGSRKKEAQP